MLEDKKLQELRKRVRQSINEGTIKTNSKIEHAGFFLKNAENSIGSANCLYVMSTNKDFQQKTGNLGLNGFLWVVNASYYSMFYNARALLESQGIKVFSDLSIHARIFDAFVYFFYLSGKLQKEPVSQYAQAKDEAMGILGKQRADELVTDYFYEKGKRSELTYQTGEFAMQGKAKTSLERAKNFNKEIRRILNEKVDKYG